MLLEHVRGLARELACAFDAPYGDPGAMDVPEAEGDSHPVHLEDRVGCRRFVARRVGRARGSRRSSRSPSSRSPRRADAEGGSHARGGSCT